MLAHLKTREKGLASTILNVQFTLSWVTPGCDRKKEWTYEETWKQWSSTGENCTGERCEWISDSKSYGLWPKLRSKLTIKGPNLVITYFPAGNGKPASCWSVTGVIALRIVNALKLPNISGGLFLHLSSFSWSHNFWRLANPRLSTRHCPVPLCRKAKRKLAIMIFWYISLIASKKKMGLLNQS